MIKFKIKNKTYQVPASWHEFSYELYLNYVKSVKKEDGILKIVSVLSEADYEFLKNHTVVGAENLIRCLHYLKTPPDFGGYTEKIGPYKLPVNNKGQFAIEFESLAQFEDMRGVMKRIPENGFMELLEAYPVFCAIYLQKIRDGEYSYSKAMTMVDEVKLMPFPDVMIAGSFFFLKLLNLSNGTESSYRPRKKTPKQKKQGGRASLKRTVRTHK